jgi:hypothetical protein
MTIDKLREFAEAHGWAWARYSNLRSGAESGHLVCEAGIVSVIDGRLVAVTGDTMHTFADDELTGLAVTMQPLKRGAVLPAIAIESILALRKPERGILQ